MYKPYSLAALILIAGCAANDANQDAPSAGGSRIISQIALPLLPQSPASPAESVNRTFQTRSASGWVKGSGDWSLRTEVSHRALRCATYETGIQLGTGDSACTRVDWLGDPDFATRRTQCNGATLIHSGGGTLPQSAVEPANCVRVLIRCTGAC